MVAFFLGVSFLALVCCSEENLMNLTEKTKRSNFGGENQTGVTKSGELCRIVRKNDKDTVNTNSEIRKFIDREKGIDNTTTQNGVKYDCFMQLDTEEYTLANYQKHFDSRFAKEFFYFKSRTLWSECHRFNYARLCIESIDGQQLICQTTEECIQTSKKVMELEEKAKAYKIECEKHRSERMVIYCGIAVFLFGAILLVVNVVYMKRKRQNTSV